MFEPNKTYLFDPAHPWRNERQVRRLVYIRPVGGRARMEMFRSAVAPWRETFTPAQLGDYEIKEVTR
jgi:hypothetical protein